jgi:hypothetical protein
MEIEDLDSGGAASSSNGPGTGPQAEDNQLQQQVSRGDEQGRAKARAWLAAGKSRAAQGLGSVGATMGQVSDKLKLSALSRPTSSQLGEEVTSTKGWLTQKFAQFGLRMVGKDIRYMAVGGALVYAGFLAVLAAAINILASVLPRWLASFIVGGATAGVGYFLIQKGQKEQKETKRPSD